MCVVLSEGFKNKVEEEWKELSRQLRLVLKEVEEENENRDSPSDLIAEDETTDRYGQNFPNLWIFVTSFGFLGCFALALTACFSWCCDFW